MKILLINATAVPITHTATGEVLKNDNGEPIKVIVFSSQSKEYRGAKAKALNKRMGRKAKAPTAEMVDADAIEMLVTCTHSLENFDNVEFEDGVFVSMDNLEQTYTNVPWFKDQVDIAIGDNALFLLDSSTTAKNA